MIHSVVRLWWWLNAKKLGRDEYTLLLRSAVARMVYRHFSVDRFGPGKILLDEKLGRAELMLTAWKMLSLSRPADPPYRDLHNALKEFTRFQAQIESAFVAFQSFQDNEKMVGHLSRGLLSAEKGCIEAAQVVEEGLRQFGAMELVELMGRRLAGLLGTMFCHDAVNAAHQSDLDVDEVEALVDKFSISLHCRRCGKLEAVEPRAAVEGMEEEATRIVRHWHDIGCRRKAA